MNSINKVILVGRLGKDPELKYTPSGQPVASFTMATNETWNDKNGQKQERTEWHKIVVWGKLAEICSEYLTKGRQVYIEGRIQTRQWEDKDGNKRSTTEVVCRDMVMMGGGGGGGGTRDPENRTPPGPESEPQGAGGVEEEDIPF